MDHHSSAQIEGCGGGEGPRGATVGAGGGAAGPAGATGRDDGGPVKSRRGNKFGVEGRARTVPVRCTQGSPEGG